MLDEPAGLLSVPGRGPGLEDSTLCRVAARHPAVYAARVASHLAQDEGRVETGAAPR